MTRRRRVRDPDLELLKKGLRAIRAKSWVARTNYVIDILAELRLRNLPLDEFLHMLNEFTLGEGTPLERIERWLQKMRRYRLVRGGLR